MKIKLAIAVLALLPALVLAQNAPNMIGTWTGTFTNTVMGTAAHHDLPNKKDTEIYFNKNIPFNLIIDRQEETSFSGTFSTPKHKEVILGAIAPDFQGGVMVDGDGTNAFKIIDANTIQNCYVQMTKPKVAGCWIAKKQ
jgi:hypothetical protein